MSEAKWPTGLRALTMEEGHLVNLTLHDLIRTYFCFHSQGDYEGDNAEFNDRKVSVQEQSERQGWEGRFPGGLSVSFPQLLHP